MHSFKKNSVNTDTHIPTNTYFYKHTRTSIPISKSKKLSRFDLKIYKVEQSHPTKIIISHKYDTHINYKILT
jgi:hypothetical protein